MRFWKLRHRSPELHENMKMQEANELCGHACLEIFIFKSLERFYDSWKWSKCGASYTQPHCTATVPKVQAKRNVYIGAHVSEPPNFWEKTTQQSQPHPRTNSNKCTCARMAQAISMHSPVGVLCPLVVCFYGWSVNSLLLGQGQASQIWVAMA